MTAKQKEVIYIDVEDDITTVIEKATSSKAALIALVLPKRYSTLKSSVNMKLLKKSSAKARKKLVLITDDDALSALAGSVAIHVAPNLKTRPTVPKSHASTTSAKTETVEESIGSKRKPNKQEDDKADTSLGEDMDAGSVKSKPKDQGKDDGGSKKQSGRAAKINKIRQSSKIKVPNFGLFKVRLALLGLGLVLLAAGWFYAFRVAPVASVVIQAQTSVVETRVGVKVNTTTDDFESEKYAVLEGTTEEISRTLTQRFEATGEKDNGEKAGGDATIQNCDDSDVISVPSGTQLVDSNSGIRFVTDQAASVPGAFLDSGDIVCGSVSVTVTAAENGDDKNLSARSYSLAGFEGILSASGGQMTGGTSEIVEVVSQADIDSATKQLLDKTDDTVRAELASKFDESMVVINQSFRTAIADSIPANKDGDEVAESSVSAEFTYTIVGIQKDALSDALRAEQEKEVDPQTQGVLDTGVDAAELRVSEESGGIFSVNISTQGRIGPDISEEEIANSIAGQRYSEALETLRALSGVRDASLDLSPFWVFSVPEADKVTVEVQIAGEGSESP